MIKDNSIIKVVAGKVATIDLTTKYLKYIKSTIDFAAASKKLGTVAAAGDMALHKDIFNKTSKALGRSIYGPVSANYILNTVGVAVLAFDAFNYLYEYRQAKHKDLFGLKLKATFFCLSMPQLIMPFVLPIHLQMLGLVVGCSIGIISIAIGFSAQEIITHNKIRENEFKICNFHSVVATYKTTANNIKKDIRALEAEIIRQEQLAEEANTQETRDKILNSTFAMLMRLDKKQSELESVECSMSTKLQEIKKLKEEVQKLQQKSMYYMITNIMPSGLGLVSCGLLLVTAIIGANVANLPIMYMATCLSFVAGTIKIVDTIKKNHFSKAAMVESKEAIVAKD